MSYTVYGASVSPFVRKVRVVLEEKALPYTLVPVSPFDPSEEFLERSPLRRIPVLADLSGTEEVVIPDSSVISDYLEHRHPEPSLVSKDPATRAQTLWLEEHADGGFIPKVGPAVFRAVVLNQLQGKEPEIERANTCLREEAPSFLDYYENQLGDGEFLVGSQLSLADIAVASPFVNLHHAGCEVPSDRWPRLAAFLVRMMERPSFKSCIEDETMFHRPVELSWS